MDFTEYQTQSRKSDISRDDEKDRMFIPLLGLAGEAGSLLSEFKKKYRDGDRYVLFDDRIKEELGDVLWYLSTIASRCNFDLDEIARFNLSKNSDQWPQSTDQQHLPFASIGSFDSDYPDSQRLPESADFRLTESGGISRIFLNDSQYPLGDPLTDNVWTEDGYRFHDVFHITFATILNWSPITRRLLNCKRKSNDKVDEVEDGGRAGIIEEAVIAVVFEYARSRDFLEGCAEIDYETIRTIRQLTSPYEIQVASSSLWTFAILRGFDIWRQVNKAGGGIVSCDSTNKKISFKPLTLKGAE